MNADDHRVDVAGGAEPSNGRSRWGAALLIACCFALILGAKWFVIGRFGVNVPFLDQWDAEIPLYQAYNGGELSCGVLFGGHNEHRILTTRLWHLGLYVLNGRVWNVRLQMAANAVVHAAAIVILCGVLSGGLPWPGRLLVWGVGTVAGVLPTGWVNTLGGFQVQFHFCLLFQCLALALLLRARPLTFKWWLAWIPMALAVFSMGGGFIVALAACGTIVFVCWTAGEFDRRRLMAAGLLLACAIAGYASLPAVSPNADPRPQGIGQFLSALSRVLSWPYPKNSGAWLLIYLPGLVLVLYCLVKRAPVSTSVRMTVGFGLLGVLLAVATSYARGAEPLIPCSRYTDNLLIGVLANLTALIHLGFSTKIGLCKSRRLALALTAWLLLIAGGYLANSVIGYGWNVGPFMRRDQANVMKRNLENYIRTGDREWLLTHGPVPYFIDPARMRKLADDPDVRQVIPPEILPALTGDVIVCDGVAGAPGPERGAIGSRECVYTLGAETNRTGTGKLVVRFRLPRGPSCVALGVLTTRAGGDQAISLVAGGHERRIYPDLHRAVGLKTVYVHVPGDRFDLVATDHGRVDGDLLAFSPPRVAGRLTALLEGVLAGWLWPVALGIAGLVFLVCLRVAEDTA